MHKCRLCLENRKNCVSIFTGRSCNSAICFADIVTSMTNVKVYKDDSLTDQICRTCRRKTRELYNFKLQVERSYAALQEIFNLKRISFDNIHDVKLDIKTNENNAKNHPPFALTEYLMSNSEEPFHYIDVIMKKVPIDDKQITLINFLIPINEQLENNYAETDTNYEDSSKNLDFEYDPVLKLQSSIRKKNHKTRKQQNRHKTVNQVFPSKPIQPVYLTDYKLLSTKQEVHKDRDSKSHICPYCGKMTRTIKSHLRTHLGEKKYKCDKCTNAYLSQSSLKQHIVSSHALRNVKCDKCVATFPTSYALKKHMISHLNERRHVCEICSKSFNLKPHLKRHKQIVHNLGARPWKCELCSDTFNSKFGLAHHMRVHTGERPYKCEICSQPYSYKHDFNRHCLKKHGVCFKRRSVYIMNEEVLIQERNLMRDLILRVNGVIKDDRPINPFEGPQAAQAFEQVINSIQSGKVIVDCGLTILDRIGNTKVGDY